jgi:hypothetical protein
MDTLVTGPLVISFIAVVPWLIALLVARRHGGRVQ